MKEANKKSAENSNCQYPSDSIFFEIKSLIKKYINLHPIDSKKRIQINIKLEIERNHNETLLYNIGDDPKMIINRFCDLHHININNRQKIARNVIEKIKQYLENEGNLKDETIINELEVDKTIGNENIDQPIGEEEIINCPLLSVNRKTIKSEFKYSFLNFNCGTISKIFPYSSKNASNICSIKNRCCHLFQALQKGNILSSRKIDNSSIQNKSYYSSPKICTFRTNNQPEKSNQKSSLKQNKCVGPSFCKSINLLRKKKYICNLNNSKVRNYDSEKSFSPIEKVEEKLIRIGRNYLQNSYQKRIDSFIQGQKECSFSPTLNANSPKQKALQKKNKIYSYDHLGEGREYQNIKDLPNISPDCYYSPINLIRNQNCQHSFSRKKILEKHSIKENNIPIKDHKIKKIDSAIFKSFNLNNKRNDKKIKDKYNSKLEIAKSQIFEKIFHLLDREDKGYISKSHITITSIFDIDLSMPIFKIYKNYLHRIETDQMIAIQKIQFLNDSNKIFNSLSRSDQNKLLECFQSSPFRKNKNKNKNKNR